MALSGSGFFLTFLLVGILLLSSTHGLECVYCIGTEDPKSSRMTTQEFARKLIAKGNEISCNKYQDGSTPDSAFAVDCNDFTDMDFGPNDPSNTALYKGVTDFVCTAQILGDSTSTSAIVARSCYPRHKATLGEDNCKPVELGGISATPCFCDTNMCDAKDPKRGGLSAKDDNSGAGGWGFSWRGRVILLVGLISSWMARELIN